MVHQHLMLIDNLTVFDNLIIGNQPGWVFLAREVAAQTTQLGHRYGIDVDLGLAVSHLSVGEQQRVEILKALVRGARILILDEPTAVLTPQEVTALAKTLRRLASEGHGILIVTHKLPEVMAMSDRVTVMRRGRVVGTWRTEETTEKELVEYMVGRSLEGILPRTARALGTPMLFLHDVRAPGDGGRIGLNGIDLEVAAGEILGIAGVEGNGQRELAEVITGLRHAQSGEIVLDGSAITNQATEDILYAGVAHIPEDRNREGLVMDFSIAENAILVNHDRAPMPAARIHQRTRGQSLRRRSDPRFRHQVHWRTGTDARTVRRQSAKAGAGKRTVAKSQTACRNAAHARARRRSH